MKPKYVIKFENEKETLFFAIDRDSGGYPYLTDDLFSAKLFNNLEVAIDTVRTEFEKEKRDGRFPGRNRYQATGISFTKKLGTASVSVCPLIIGEPVQVPYTFTETIPDE